MRQGVNENYLVRDLDQLGVEVVHFGVQEALELVNKLQLDSLRLGFEKVTLGGIALFE
jgi:hypothetical protein